MRKLGVCDYKRGMFTAGYSNLNATAQFLYALDGVRHRRRSSSHAFIILHQTPPRTWLHPTPLALCVPPASSRALLSAFAAIVALASTSTFVSKGPAHPPLSGRDGEWASPFTPVVLCTPGIVAQLGGTLASLYAMPSMERLSWGRAIILKSLFTFDYDLRGKTAVSARTTYSISRRTAGPVHTFDVGLGGRRSCARARCVEQQQPAVCETAVSRSLRFPTENAPTVPVGPYTLRKGRLVGIL